MIYIYSFCQNPVGTFKECISRYSRPHLSRMNVSGKAREWDGWFHYLIEYGHTFSFLLKKVLVKNRFK